MPGTYYGSSATVTRGHFDSLDPAEDRRSPKRSSKKLSNKNRRYTDELTIIDFIITRKFNPNIKKEFPNNTDPKLKKLIQKKYEDQYEWAKQQPLFKTRFLKIRKSMKKHQKKEKLDTSVVDETQLNINIDKLQKKRGELIDELATIDQEILLLKTALENR
tara:strand:+ start:971 stop:1453 length:483 start_codon:yes stop_codon:yes gene_type:complete